MTMKVGLFIPCYINAIYPNVGVASYKLLKSLGVDVDYPLDQTCCGQPAQRDFLPCSLHRDFVLLPIQNRRTCEVNL